MIDGFLQAILNNLTNWIVAALLAVFGITVGGCKLLDYVPAAGNECCEWAVENCNECLNPLPDWLDDLLD